MISKIAVAALGVLGVQGTICGTQLKSPKDINSFPVYPAKEDILAGKVITKNVWKEVSAKKDKYGFSIQDQIFSGCKHTDSAIGVYATSADAYTTFSRMYDPLIDRYHSKNRKPYKRDMDFKKLTFNLRPDEKKMIKSVRVRVARNLDGYPFGAGINRQQRLEVEKKIVSTLRALDGETKGTYYSLRTMGMREKKKLIANHYLFKEGDKYLEAAGLTRDWPEGRGIFYNKEKTFIVWVNEEDQLRIISMADGADAVPVFMRLARALAEMEKTLTFARDKNLGFLSSCPSNLGTGMRASVHIAIPNLDQEKNQKQLKQLANSFNLSIRGVDGEHSKSKGGVYDISNKQRLGKSELWLAQNLLNGVKAIIQAENKLEIIRKHAEDL